MTKVETRMRKRLKQYNRENVEPVEEACYEKNNVMQQNKLDLLQITLLGRNSYTQGNSIFNWCLSFSNILYIPGYLVSHLPQG